MFVYTVCVCVSQNENQTLRTIVLLCCGGNVLDLIYHKDIASVPVKRLEAETHTHTQKHMPPNNCQSFKSDLPLWQSVHAPTRCLSFGRISPVIISSGVLLIRPRKATDVNSCHLLSAS